MNENFENIIDGQIDLGEMKVGDKYAIDTQNTEYILERRVDGFYLSGNEKYCPSPRKVNFNEDTIYTNGYMVYDVIEGSTDIRTSQISGIERIN